MPWNLEKKLEISKKNYEIIESLKRFRDFNLIYNIEVISSNFGNFITEPKKVLERRSHFRKNFTSLDSQV